MRLDKLYIIVLIKGLSSERAPYGANAQIADLRTA